MLTFANAHQQVTVITPIVYRLRPQLPNNISSVTGNGLVHNTLVESSGNCVRTADRKTNNAFRGLLGSARAGVVPTTTGNSGGIDGVATGGAARPGDLPLESWESRAAARAAQLARDLELQEQRAALFKNLTPLEQAFLERGNGPVKPSSALHMICDQIIKKCKMFGWPLLTPEEVRHKRQVLKEVAKIEGEREAQGDTAFWNKEALWEMAEDRLRRERGRGANRDRRLHQTER